MNVRERAEAWIAEDPDPATRAELVALLDDPAELEARFGGHLEFGTAGLRGELGAGPNRMNRVVVRRAAAGLAAVLGRERHVVIGYDGRHKSAVFATDSAAVLTGAGLRVSVMPGPLPTPVLAFAVRHLRADAGIMVTASHNPPQDNGYKIYWCDGSQIIPPIDQEIAQAIDGVSGVPLAPGWTTLDDEIVKAYLRAVTALPIGEDRDIQVAYTPLHGVGGGTLYRAFTIAGFPAPRTVPEQSSPDPDFPTVPFPNPEEPGVLDLVRESALAHGADLVIANDPDADRLAVAIPGGRVLTGDEVGCLLAEHVLRHTDPSAPRLVASTIVSSSLLGKIAASHGVRHVETLTGFKWIMKAGEGLVFGYEEAIGYSVGGDDGVPVYDKDGIGAALVVTGLAASAKRAGRTLLDLLDDQARRYGLHATAQLSTRFADRFAIQRVMAGLREKPPVELGGRPLESAEDLLAGNGLPPTDGLRYRLAGDARVLIRPSGTEPKLKAYFEVVIPVIGEDVAAARAHAETELQSLKTALSTHLA